MQPTDHNTCKQTQHNTSTNPDIIQDTNRNFLLATPERLTNENDFEIRDQSKKKFADEVRNQSKTENTQRSQTVEHKNTEQSKDESASGFRTFNRNKNINYRKEISFSQDYCHSRSKHREERDNVKDRRKRVNRRSGGRSPHSRLHL